MTTTMPAGDAGETEARNGFFINAGTHSGWFTTHHGDIYDIRKLEPREVTDPRDGTVSTIWGGYATARDRDLAARDAMMQAKFNKDGERPADLFDPKSKDIPLYITLRHRPGKGFTDIGSFWNSKGRHTVLARDLEGKRGLRFGGNMLEWKSAAVLEAERASRTEVAAEPDAAAARSGAATRSRKRGEPAAQAAEKS